MQTIFWIYLNIYEKITLKLNKLKALIFRKSHPKVFCKSVVLQTDFIEQLRKGASAFSVNMQKITVCFQIINKVFLERFLLGLYLLSHFQSLSNDLILSIYNFFTISQL